MKVSVLPLSKIKFAQKDEQVEEDMSVSARLHRLQTYFQEHGTRTYVEAVIVTHVHGHPHVLLLQIGTTFFKLPGDYIQPGSDPIDGLRERLNTQLSRLSGTNPTTGSPEYEGGNDWNISACVARWWRPNFETFLYPFCPPHITKPKEVKLQYLVTVPADRTIYIPRSMKIVAVPLFELAENASRFGNQISALPVALSHLDFTFE
ncbi:Cleavage/polyadenylation specificity factor subunit 5 [Blastocladiella britannica]|nr:Cleavage/polyadenylation specificity factor subunit 5 [Blastocladiella britannica]